MYNLAEIKSQIASGAKFNGTVYGKYGKKVAVFFVYINGNCIRICEVDKAAYAETKTAIEAELAEISVVPATSAKDNSNVAVQKNTWLVDGRPVTNNLNYGEMWDKYGMDFE